MAEGPNRGALCEKRPRTLIQLLLVVVRCDGRAVYINAHFLAADCADEREPGKPDRQWRGGHSSCHGEYSLAIKYPCDASNWKIAAC